MARYSEVRDALRSDKIAYRHLDAAQLVKHAYGLVTDGRRLGLIPHLAYIFAEPKVRGDVSIPLEDRERHREEVADFADRVAGDEVRFGWIDYRSWFNAALEPVHEHANAIIGAFDL